MRVSKKDKKRSQSPAGRKPKKKCCVSKPKCRRCPLRMLAEGTLPDGYTVKKRRLVTIDGGSTKPKNKRKGKGKVKGNGKGTKRPQAA